MQNGAQHNFHYNIYDDITDLPTSDAELITKAKEISKLAYAPYSNFFVGSAALLKNKKIVTGTNQENSSYPVGICAERVMLAAISTVDRNQPILAMAISYYNLKGKNDTPISPCGMCRQALLEYETKTKHSIKLYLSAQKGKIYCINKIEDLLPLAFTNKNLGADNQ